MCRVLAPLLLLALGGAGIAGYLYGRDTHDPRYMVMSQPIPILALTGTGPTLPNTPSLVCMLPYFLLTLSRVLSVAVAYRRHTHGWSSSWYGRLVCVGLLLGGVGDVLMQLNKEFPSMFCVILMHLCYALAFSSRATGTQDAAESDAVTQSPRAGAFASGAGAGAGAAGAGAVAAGFGAGGGRTALLADASATTTAMVVDTGGSETPPTHVQVQRILVHRNHAAARLDSPAHGNGNQRYPRVPLRPLVALPYAVVGVVAAVALFMSTLKAGVVLPFMVDLGALAGLSWRATARIGYLVAFPFSCSCGCRCLHNLTSGCWNCGNTFGGGPRVVYVPSTLSGERLACHFLALAAALGLVLSQQLLVASRYRPDFPVSSLVGLAIYWVSQAAVAASIPPLSPDARARLRRRQQQEKGLELP